MYKNNQPLADCFYYNKIIGLVIHNCVKIWKKYSFLLTNDNLSSYNGAGPEKGSGTVPKDTFFKLKDEKRNHLLEAAKREFTRVLLKDASINRIVQDAKISRGSFYLYFNDIEDLYFYVLVQHRQILWDRFLTLIKEKEDLVDVFEQLYLDIIHYCSQKDRKQYFKNVLLNMNVHMENDFSSPSNFTFSKIQKEKEKMYLLISTASFTTEAKENLDDVFSLLFHVTIYNLMPVLLFDCPLIEAKKRYHRQLQLLFHVFLKKGNDLC